MTSKTDPRANAFKQGISEIAMEEIIFYTLNGYVPANMDNFANKSDTSNKTSNAFPMIKYGVEAKCYPPVIVDLDRQSLAFHQAVHNKVLRGEPASFIASQSAFDMKTKSKSRKAILFTCAKLDEEYSYCGRHLVYRCNNPLPSQRNYNSKLLQRGVAPTINEIMNQNNKKHSNDNILHANNEDATKLTLGYMRELNMSIASIYSRNPDAIYHSNGEKGEFNMSQLIDNNLWLLQEEFIRNPNSEQAAIVNFYRGLLKQNSLDDSQTSNATADAIMASMVERNSHTSAESGQEFEQTSLASSFAKK